MFVRHFGFDDLTVRTPAAGPNFDVPVTRLGICLSAKQHDHLSVGHDWTFKSPTMGLTCLFPMFKVDCAQVIFMHVVSDSPRRIWKVGLSS